MQHSNHRLLHDADYNYSIQPGHLPLLVFWFWLSPMGQPRSQVNQCSEHSTNTATIQALHNLTGTMDLVASSIMLVWHAMFGINSLIDPAKMVDVILGTGQPSKSQVWTVDPHKCPLLS